MTFSTFTPDASGTTFTLPVCKDAMTRELHIADMGVTLPMSRGRHDPSGAAPMYPSDGGVSPIFKINGRWALAQGYDPLGTGGELGAMYNAVTRFTQIMVDGGQGILADVTPVGYAIKVSGSWIACALRNTEVKIVGNLSFAYLGQGKGVVCEITVPLSSTSGFWTCVMASGPNQLVSFH